MINIYPNFSRIDHITHPIVNNFTGKFEPYSDFNATSLLAWDVEDSIGLSLLNDNLVIRIPDYLTGKPVFSMLGDNKVEASIDKLLNNHNKLNMVPETVVEQIRNSEKFKFHEEEENFDYIYETAHLSEMLGGKYKKKRNKHNVFVRDHQNYELVVNSSRSINSLQAEEIRNIDKAWAKTNSRSMGDFLAERKALENLLNAAYNLNLILVEVRVDGELKAFSINEVLDNNFAICHFEKALLVHHQNIFTFLSAEVATILKQHGCKYINWEQDLGLDGLRRSKKSYHPVKMLKKYTIKKY